ncbi:MAG: nucleotidyltransferase family protein [Alphaproteobacteria bacterium]|nr:nucleotidyltransferase family protein [Alphaproteobacteria bacterium]
MKRTDISDNVLLAALTRPESIADLSVDEWDLLLRQARRTKVLGRLALAARECGLNGQLPERVREHFAAASAVAASHERSIFWEINRIERALADLEIPIVLLKGAAYTVAHLPPARGRLVSDIDIMVPQEALGLVEAALQRHGWEQVMLEPYDQRYFRSWMHELPPLRHRERRTFVDVHHTILPKTSRLRPDPQRLWESAKPLDQPLLYILAPTDMVLHSAAHLFHDGEINLGIRDLADINDLLVHFGEEQGFWAGLVPRALELDLVRPLFYALRYATRLLGTPLPADVMAAATVGAPPRPILGLMDRLVPGTLVPGHPDRPGRSTGRATLLLYIRSHWLKMPPWLLITHLATKALRRALSRRGSDT